MLRVRLLTAVLLAPLVVWAILSLSPPWFALLLGFVFVLGAWEWSGLARYEYLPSRISYTLLVLLLLIVLFDHRVLAFMALPIAAAACAWWLLALWQVVIFPRGSGLWSGTRILPAAAGVISLVPAWLALLVLHLEFGARYVLLLFVLIWAADSGAYFAGRRFGRHKLAPRVSPGKTREGVAGGLALALLVAALAAFWLRLPAAQAVWLIAVSLLAVAASVVGDLTESLFKRLAGLKDSGQILPGHGGLLDRIDSLLAAAPVFLFGLIGQKWL